MHFSDFPYKPSSFQTQEASDFNLSSYGFALFSTLYYFICPSLDIFLFHFVFFTTSSAEYNPTNTYSSFKIGTAG